MGRGQATRTLQVCDLSPFRDHTRMLLFRSKMDYKDQGHILSLVKVANQILMVFLLTKTGSHCPISSSLRAVLKTTGLLASHIQDQGSYSSCVAGDFSRKSESSGEMILFSM